MGLNKKIFLIPLFTWLFCSGCINPAAFLPQQGYASPKPAEIIPLLPIHPSDLVTPIQTIYVRQIEKNSPAVKAGLQPGDQILTINGRPFETVEKFYEYFKKSRWLESTYWIVRKKNRVFIEKEVTIKPEKDYPWHGIRFGFKGIENQPIFPIVRENNWLWQAKENFGIGVAMYFEGSLIKVDILINNYSDRELPLDKKSIILLDRRRIMLSILTKQEVQSEKYYDALSESPLAALQSLPTMTAGQAVVADEIILVPPGMKRYEHVYLKNVDISFPITFKVDIQKENFQFDFSRPN